MINLRSQPHEPQRFGRIHGIAGNFRHQRDILPGRQTRNKVVELKHKTNMLTMELSQLSVA